MLQDSTLKSTVIQHNSWHTQTRSCLWKFATWRFLYMELTVLNCLCYHLGFFLDVCENSLQFPLFNDLFSTFSINIILLHKNNLKVFVFKSWKKTGLILVFHVSIESTFETIWAWLVFLNGAVLRWPPVFLSWKLVCLIASLLKSIWVNCIFPRNYPRHLGFKIYLHGTFVIL